MFTGIGLFVESRIDYDGSRSVYPDRLRCGCTGYSTDGQPSRHHTRTNVRRCPVRDLLVQIELTGEYERTPLITAENTLTLLKKKTGIG
jgi:hypothetical protein